MTDNIVIIAEVGECFNGDIKQAEELIYISKDCGCDIVKFQTLDYENISEDDPEKDWFKKIALDKNKIEYLINIALKTKIEILFTPENVKTAKWLIDLGAKSVKIASSTISDKEYVSYIASNFLKVFISTGMASLDEVYTAVDTLRDVPELYIMHCISEYPTGPLLGKRGLAAMEVKDVRLNMMKILANLFPEYNVGYSDHTSGTLAAVAAAAMGARVIEKHITLDRSRPIYNFQNGMEYLGTDHVLSLEPDELREMVKMIREVEKMFGPWKWERSEGENILRRFMRERFS